MLCIHDLIRAAAIITLTIVLAACGATKPPVYPKAASLTVAASSGTIDLFNEMPAHDYYITNSQVFVGGRDSTGANIIGSMFGLIGAGISMSVNRGRNAAGLEGAEDVFRLSFAAAMDDAFQRAASERAPGKFTRVDAKATLQLLLIPSARITFTGDEDAYAVFKIKVSFVDGESKSDAKRFFQYADFSRKKILGAGGWADDGAKTLKAQGNKALPILAGVILDDMAARLQNSAAPINPRYVKIKINALPEAREFSALVLLDYPEHIALTEIFGTNIFHNNVTVYDKTAVTLTPTNAP